MVFDLRRFISPWRKATAMNSLFNPHLFVDDHTLLMKSNALCVFFEVQLSDDECLTEEVLESHSRRMQAVFRGIDERFTIYQWAMKQSGYVPAVPERLSLVVEDTIARRSEFLASKGLHQIRIVYGLLYEGSARYLKAGSFNMSRELVIEESALRRDLAVIQSQAEIFRQTSDDLLHPRLLDKAQVFGFLRFLGCLDSELADTEALKYDADVDYFMAPASFTMQREDKVPCIRINHGAVEVITLREPPRTTMPCVLRELLAIPGNFILCSQFKRVENTTAVKEIFNSKGHFRRASKNPNKSALLERAVTKKERIEGNTDEAAEDDSAEMGQILRRVNREGEYLGMFSLTMILFGHQDRQGLLGMSSQVAKVLGGLEASTIHETYNAASAYLSIIPGNTALDLRRLWLLSSNYADMSFLTAPDSGWKEIESTVTLSTAERTPYHFGIEYRGVIGLRIFGARGSGKTILSNLVLDHMQKAEPYTFILDLLGGYREITRKHSGSYVEMRLGEGLQTFRINPLVVPGTEENRQFLTQFVKVLLAEVGFECDGEEGEQLYRAITGLYKIPNKSKRTLGMLATGLPPRLKKAIAPWVGKGQYGSVFDNEDDTLSFARLQTYDFRGMQEKYASVLAPLVFCIFHRINEIVQDRSLAKYPKLLWLDEAWIFLEKEKIRDFVMEAAKTWRTYNGGVGVVTQSASDQEKLGIFHTLGELCPINILLSSPGANVEAYQKLFKLNDRQARQFGELISKRQALVLTPDGSKRVYIDLDAEALAEYGSGYIEIAARETLQSGAAA
jgi:type IV secretory pathway VirB4 component